MVQKTKVSIDVVKKVKSLLEDLATKEPVKKSLKAALQDLKPQIKTLLERGYTREEVATIVQQHGLPVNALRIRVLMAKPREPKKSVPVDGHNHKTVPANAKKPVTASR